MITLTEEQKKILGLDTLSEDELSEVAIKISAQIFERAIGVFLSDLDESEINAVNTVIESSNDFDEVMLFMDKRFPEFITVLDQQKDFFINEISSIK